MNKKIMDNKEFVEYVRDQMRMGLDHGQIAKKLGIDISEIKRRCDEADGKIVKSVESAMPKSEKKPKEKPVSGASVKKPVAEPESVEADS